MTIWLPTPADWVIIWPVVLLFIVNPFHLLDRMMDSEYLWIYNFVGFVIFLPYYLRLKKRIRKYEEDKWDQ